MPTYEYRCDKCGKKFTLVMRISEHDEKKGKLACPKCGSKNVTQEIQPFFANTSKKS
ncbi:MAG: FmdB family zinc ribbon protein [Verrucomicrobiia bacterium]|jgi:putative FmdB family regulatory protein